MKLLFSLTTFIVVTLSTLVVLTIVMNTKFATVLHPGLTYTVIKVDPRTTVFKSDKFKLPVFGQVTATARLVTVKVPALYVGDRVRVLDSGAVGSASEDARERIAVINRI